MRIGRMVWAALALGWCAHAAFGLAEPTVSVQVKDGRFNLMRNGARYVVRGVGGDGSLALLAESGGNSVRTWSADKLGEVLDQCERRGLTVTACLWLGHERHGFNYGDVGQVAKQMEAARETILKYRDHPALLIWCFGNEMEGDGNNAAIWGAVNNLASMAKRLDANHPTMTIISEVGGRKVANLHSLCPDIDIVGINSYAGAASLAERYVAAGGTKPFIVTEFGPPGTWEVAKSPWGVPVEPSSTEKAGWYRKAWEKTAAGSSLCLGAYAFLWGNKQETTATWFGMLLPDGTRLACVDTMRELWTGKPPANRCPEIAALKVVGEAQGDPKATIKVSLQAADPDGDPISVRWVLQAEATETGWGGDTESAPPTYSDATVRSDANGCEVRLPDEPGGMRLFAYVTDGKGGGATANLPLLVKGVPRKRPARKADLPLVIYDEAGRVGAPYAASGWMGNAGAVKLDEACTDRPATGKTCIRCEYTASGDWAGVIWQDPPGDWGDRPGGWNVQGARRITWKARGARGGEIVTFHFGLINPDKPYADSVRRKIENVALKADWQTYTLELPGDDLSRIKSGFGWTVAGQGKPVAFFLDDIRIE